MSYVTISMAVDGAIRSKRAANKANRQAKKGQKPGQAIQEMLLRQMRDLQPYGKQFLDRASSSLGQANDYYSKIAGGNVAEVNAALSPEIGRYNQQMDATQQNAAALSPRGGGSAAMMADMPYERTRTISNMFFGARPAAFQALAQMGGEYGRIGLGAATGQAGIAGAQANGYEALLRGQQQAYNQGSDLGGAFNQSVHGIATGLQGYFANRGNPATQTGTGAVGGGGSTGLTPGNNPYAGSGINKPVGGIGSGSAYGPGK